MPTIDCECIARCLEEPIERAFASRAAVVTPARVYVDGDLQKQVSLYLAANRVQYQDGGLFLPWTSQGDIVVTQDGSEFVVDKIERIVNKDGIAEVHITTKKEVHLEQTR